MNIKKIITIILLILILLLLKKNDDNIIYIKNFLKKDDYEIVKQLDKEKKNFVYENFRYIKPLKEKIIYDIFYSKKNMRKIQRYLNNKIYPSNFPIEHRFYHIESKGMNWHKDAMLYEKPQYEAIYTIDNNSNSYTQWEDNYGNIKKLWTEPNSLLIVKAQGYKHNVTPPINGEREILKLIYTQTQNVNDNYIIEMKRFSKL